MSEQRKFQCRIEELPVMAALLLSSFERDQDDFVSYSPKYGPEFIESYSELLGQLDTIAIPQTLRADQKNITRLMHETADSLRPLISKIEGYIKQSNTLRASIDDFGISALRKDINSKNYEGIQFYLKVLRQMLVNNSGALSEEGLPADTVETLTGILQTIQANDIQQDQKMGEHKELVNVNIELYNELWDKMYSLMDIGKRLYKQEKTYKLDDYTMASLKAKVNKERSPQVQEASAG